MKLPDTWSSTKADTRHPHFHGRSRDYPLSYSTRLFHPHVHTHYLYQNLLLFRTWRELAISKDTRNGKKGRTDEHTKVPTHQTFPFCACRTDRHIIIDTHQHFGAFFWTERTRNRGVRGIAMLHLISWFSLLSTVDDNLMELCGVLSFPLSIFLPFVFIRDLT